MIQFRAKEILIENVKHFRDVNEQEEMQADSDNELNGFIAER